MTVIPQQYVAEYPVDRLKPYANNPNEGDLGAIVESIQENQFFGAVLVHAATQTIINGEHRWRAAQVNGAETIPVFLCDIDEFHARRIRVADNRTSRLGLDNTQKLVEELDAIYREAHTLSGTGFDEEDLEGLRKDLSRLFPADDEQAKGSEPKPRVCPHCGHTWTP